jgi:hypothetical protein
VRHIDLDPWLGLQLRCGSCIVKLDIQSIPP